MIIIKEKSNITKTKNVATERLASTAQSGNSGQRASDNLGDSIGRVPRLRDQERQPVDKHQESVRHRVLGLPVLSEAERLVERQLELSHHRLRHLSARHSTRRQSFDLHLCRLDYRFGHSQAQDQLACRVLV